MKLNKYKIRRTLFSLIIIIFYSTVLFAQSENKADASKNLSVKLQQKVLLTDEQTKKVESILTEYINSGDKSMQAAADKKISTLLDERQKAKYEIIKTDMWNEANKAAANH
ncbi:MAG TPA: hypothetical protein VMT35_12365 [Ignavibacteriaceae bacterium]|nr:hypothetical protein [Ignavibacteriaceae bacterium]